MPFPKGKPRPAGAGRRKGTPNILTISVREAVKKAFDELQKDPDANLTTWGRANPTEFYKISSRLIPAEITGPDGGAIPHIVNVAFVALKSDDKS